MSGILFLAHRLPFPPDRGDKIRSHHVLRALARLAPVHVGCLAESAAEREHEAELAELAASHCMPLRSKPLLPAALEAFARREPVSLAAFRHPELARWVRDVLAREDIDTVYVFSGQMGQYLPPEWSGQLVVDLVDVDSAKFEAYAEEGGPLTRWVHAREARLLAREEARLAGRAERTLLVSDAEADLLRARAPHARRVEALGNGIDAGLFDPQSVPPHPQLAGAPGPHLLFTGQMDYPPNVNAALRTIDRLLPAVRQAHPHAQFHVVGRSPARELSARHGREGVHVWGEVPDVRPFLAAARLMIAPLELARGVQNKVLEAMAMARPVVLTPQAATGIDARDGEHFWIAGSDGEFVEKALELLAYPREAAELGQAARRFVVERMTWPAMLARLPEIVGRSQPGEKRDAA
jgi:sugar transferase (PEP-CTERM/EpsH1 system associated)